MSGDPIRSRQGVEGWTGSTLSGSERVKAAEKEAAAAAKAAGTPKKVEPKKVEADKLVPDPPKKKYAFDPFDQSSWWKPNATKGSKVDAKL